MASVIYLLLLFLLFIALILFGLIYFLSTEMPTFGIISNTFGRDIKGAFLYFKILYFAKKCHLLDQTMLDYFRLNCQESPNKICFIFEDEKWTYKRVDDFSNKVANYFLSIGYSKGDEAALLLENCPEFICIWLGLAKIGVITALINTNLRGDSLGHSVTCINTKALIFGRSFSNHVNDAMPFLKKNDTMDFYCFTEQGASLDPVVPFTSKSLNAILEEAPSTPIDPQKHKVGFQDKLMYIYTSGTTGLPKAAIIRHSRFLWMGCGPYFLGRCSKSERIYNPLPLYHSAGGILFVCVVMTFGGTLIIRKKFSASNYWKEAAEHKATIGQYIGEICRYLLNQPVREEEKQHCMRLMFGNGLRPHIWPEFQSRFRVRDIVEFYGATEGNANLVNIFGKVGAVGFVPRYCDKIYPVALIRIDPETHEVLRNEEGLCIRCKPGEPGELAGKIIRNAVNEFDGYANKSDTKKKLIHNCFEKGDTAFLSGDILMMDELGYLYFMDRTGDTFRWRGENVSTGEVENVLSKALGHVSCIVYGVEIPMYTNMTCACRD